MGPELNPNRIALSQLLITVSTLSGYYDDRSRYLHTDVCHQSSWATKSRTGTEKIGQRQDYDPQILVSKINSHSIPLSG